VPQRIVLIEDENQIVELVRYNFRKAGFDLESFPRGSEGLDFIRHNTADLVLLDIMLPDLDGFEVCRALRADERTRALPVIFLTAKGQEADRVRGLEIGADDYVVKPFSPRELVARVKAVLRRETRGVLRAQIVAGPDLCIDAVAREVTVRGRLVELSALEFRLLHFLASNPRRVFDRHRLIEEVWGINHHATPRTVDVHVRHIREKIEEQPNRPRYLQTVRGAGYRFSLEGIAEAPEERGAGSP